MSLTIVVLAIACGAGLELLVFVRMVLRISGRSVYPAAQPSVPECCQIEFAGLPGSGWRNFQQLVGAVNFGRRLGWPLIRIPRQTHKTAALPPQQKT